MEFFSCGTPNLVAVILAMSHIDKNFMEQTQPTSKMHPAIWYTLTLAKKMLNRYYSLTDHVKVYQIAMSTFLTITLNTDHKVSSSSSTAQTWLLSCCRLAIRMDWNHWSTCTWRIQQDLQEHQAGRRGQLDEQRIIGIGGGGQLDEQRIIEIGGGGEGMHKSSSIWFC